ncbi:uncharacterized protein LOC135927656 isoform X2 [Gordionus sp. m RMFG-2023]|uniref:uncharacterized protein LOC135927656 isoform X2 n=1 Tax=Gordionus sp. m RMFG-2023 TaxID=3053472 RepID=UPI0031FD8A33
MPSHSGNAILKEGSVPSIFNSRPLQDITNIPSNTNNTPTNFNYIEKNDHTYATNIYSLAKKKKLEIPINTLEVEGLEEPVRDNSPKTSTSYPNYLEGRCLDESVRAKKKKLEIPINTLEVEGLEEPVRDNCPKTSTSYHNTLECGCLDESVRDINHDILSNKLLCVNTDSTKLLTIRFNLQNLPRSS